MKKAILLATLSVVFVAGCTQMDITNIIQTTNTVMGGTGLVITDFAADQLEVYGGQTDRIMMTVSNKGGYAVPEEEALVYLIGSIKLDGDETMYWTGEDEEVIKSLEKTMDPADPVRDTPADEKTVSWSLTAPTVAKGDQIPYRFTGRVYSNYQTRITGNVWVYSESEADAARASGTTLNRATWSATAGPVAITARLSQDPVVLYEGDKQMTLIIKISNAGSGVIYDKDAITDYSTAGPEDLKLTSDQIYKVYVSGNVAGVDLPDSCSGEQELVGGKDLTLACDIDVTAPPTFEVVPITITAEYGYYSERSTEVVVSGR